MLVNLYANNLEKGIEEMPEANTVSAFVDAWADARKRNTGFFEKYSWGNTLDVLVSRMEKKLTLRTKWQAYRQKGIVPVKSQPSLHSTRVAAREERVAIPPLQDTKPTPQSTHAIAPPEHAAAQPAQDAKQKPQAPGWDVKPAQRSEKKLYLGEHADPAERIPD